MVKKPDKMVPEVRFKGFTDDWEQRKLKELVLQHQAGIYIKKEKYGSGKNIIGVQNFYTSDSVDGEIYRLAPVDDNSYLLHTGDLVYSESSLVPSGIARTLYVTKKGNGTAYAWHTRKYSVKQDIINSAFLSLSMDYCLRIRRHLMRTATQTAMTGITTKDYFNSSIRYPQISEQIKISEIIKKINTIISLQQRKLEQLQLLKRAMLQKLFAGQDKPQPVLRFKGFTSNWTQHQLKEVIEKVYSGLTGKNKSDFGHGQAKYITYLNVHDNAIADPTGTEQIEIDSKQNTVNKNDLLFTISSEVPEEVAYNSVWPVDEDNVYLNSFCFGITPQEEIVNSFFLSYCLRSPKMRAAIYPLAQGISRFNISKKNLLKLNITIPALSEQEDIFKNLRLIERLVDLQRDYLYQLTTLKNFLLQKLFI